LTMHDFVGGVRRRGGGMVRKLSGSDRTHS
jgi:hypothetical protein